VPQRFCRFAGSEARRAHCAKVLRANGFTEHELDLLFKINPAKILGIAPPAGTN
jgi:uncharacterized protein YfaT (DUF1175 family)